MYTSGIFVCQIISNVLAWSSLTIIGLLITVFDEKIWFSRGTIYTQQQTVLSHLDQYINYRVVITLISNWLELSMKWTAISSGRVYVLFDATMVINTRAWGYHYKNRIVTEDPDTMYSI